MCAVSLNGRDSAISKEVGVTSTRYRRFRGYSISERVSVYEYRDSGIGNPKKAKKKIGST